MLFHDEALSSNLAQLYYIIYDIICFKCGSVAQAVRRSPPIARIPNSCLGHSMCFSRWMNLSPGRFLSGFLSFSLAIYFISVLLHTHLVHFICPCDGATGVVGRHPCYSRTYNIGVSSHLIPRPDLVFDASWGYLFIYKKDKIWLQIKFDLGEWTQSIRYHVTVRLVNRWTTCCNAKVNVMTFASWLRRLENCKNCVYAFFPYIFISSNCLAQLLSIFNVKRLCSRYNWKKKVFFCRLFGISAVVELSSW